MEAGISQYDIVLVDLNVPEPMKDRGAEIQKTRACVVLSPDVMNRYLRTIVVAPMTTKSKPFPTRVRVRHYKQTGWIIVDQVRTVDRARVLKKLDALTNPEIRKLKNVIRETYVE